MYELLNGTCIVIQEPCLLAPDPIANCVSCWTDDTEKCGSCSEGFSVNDERDACVGKKNRCC